MTKRQSNAEFRNVTLDFWLINSSGHLETRTAVQSVTLFLYIILGRRH